MSDWSWRCHHTSSSSAPPSPLSSMLMGAVDVACDESNVFRHGGFCVMCDLGRWPGYGLPWNLYKTNEWIFYLLSPQNSVHVPWYIYVQVLCTSSDLYVHVSACTMHNPCMYTYRTTYIEIHRNQKHADPPPATATAGSSNDITYFLGQQWRMPPPL